MVKKLRLDLYDLKLYVRIALFVSVFIMFILGNNILENFFFMKIWFFNVYQLFWLILMVEMIIAFIPKLNKYVGCGKVFIDLYKPISHSKEKLDLDRKKANIKAAIVAVLWVALLFVIGVLKGNKILTDKFILLISFFFFLADQICVNIWCPFRKIIMKNKCCNSCRIFNWGHFMMFSPLIFILSFWTWSLFFLSLAILLHWEITHIKHPERFSVVSNASLKCSECNAKCKWLKREGTFPQ